MFKNLISLLGEYEPNKSKVSVEGECHGIRKWDPAYEFGEGYTNSNLFNSVCVKDEWCRGLVLVDYFYAALGALCFWIHRCPGRLF